jgi:hypothetical protein
MEIHHVRHVTTPTTAVRVGEWEIDVARRELRPVELPSRSAVARSTSSKFWFARPASSSPSTISRVAYGRARLSRTMHFNFTYRQFARRSARIVNS